jgi:hypothetical protein
MFNPKKNRVMYRRPKFNLAMPVSTKIQRCREIIRSLSVNSGDFPAPPVALADFEGHVNRLETASQQAFQGGVRHTAERNARLTMVNGDIRALRGYVDSVARGDLEMVLRSGFEPSRVPRPVGMLPEPQNLRATPGAHPGTVNLRWRIVKGADSYHLQVREELPLRETSVEATVVKEAWRDLPSTTRSTMEVTGLQSLRYHWFRVAALGSAGLGPWSDPARGASL